MAVHLPGATKKTSARPFAPGLGRARKVGLLGTVRTTLWQTPWSDPSWEFWGGSSVVNFCPGERIDYLFEMHPKFCFEEQRKNGFKEYYTFLQRTRTPVIMQSAYEAIPASIRYPIEQIQTEFPGLHFGSMTAYALALALMQGVTDLGFWGIEYGHDTERNDGQDRRTQRENLLMWIGIAIGRGVKLHIPKNCHLLDQPAYKDGGMDYGLDLSPAQYEEDKLRFSTAIKRTKFQPAGLVPLNTPEDFAKAAAIRAAKNPEFVEEEAKIRKTDGEIPDEFKRRDAPGDAVGDRHSDGAPGVPADGAVSPSRADVQGAPRASRAKGKVRRRVNGAQRGGRRVSPGRGHGAVQSPVSARPASAHKPSAVRCRTGAGGRKPVARIRGAARPSGKSTRTRS